MEDEAQRIADRIGRAVAAVESLQHLPFAEPFRIYVCSSQESFNAYMGAPPGATARGVKVGNDVFLSPEAFASWRGDTHDGVLRHELSHLLVYQRIGHLRYLWGIPSWFAEGLAVAVSGAGGEGVTPAQALEAIAAGRAFTPDVQGGLIRPKKAGDYGLDAFMFYRQSELFVEYMRERQPDAFEDFLLVLESGEWDSFATLFEDSFGTTVTDMWSGFVGYVRASLQG
jgi:hypothetical protein